MSGSTCFGVPVKYVLGNKINGYWIEGYLAVSLGPKINHKIKCLLLVKEKLLYFQSIEQRL